MKRTLLSFSFLGLATAAVFACSSNKPNPPMTPTTTPDAGASDAGMVMAPPPDAGPVATGPVFFTDAGTPPVNPMTDQALDVALDALVTASAAKNAPKMAEEGAPGRYTLKEGEHWGMMVTLQPGRCYTIIGAALPGTVAELDLKLFMPPLYSGADSGHSSPNEKNMPVIGKGAAATCPMMPVAIPYKLDIAATKGAGRIAVHVYSRSK
jgi:hypothetical protein